MSPRYIGAESLKMRRTWTVWLMLLGPTGVVSLNAVRYAFLYDQLVKPGADHWRTLTEFVHLLLIIALPLGIAIQASLLAGHEHQGRMWKQLRALPVSPYRLYIGKFALLAGLIVASGALAGIETVALGMALGFGADVPWRLIVSEAFGPALAALPMMAAQLFLSVMFANQAMPLTLGCLGLIAGMTVSRWWFPWSYPNVASALAHEHYIRYIIAGIAVGLLLIFAGASRFAKQEVH